MDNSLKGLILAAGAVITCIVIGLGFYLSREAQNTNSNGASQINSINSQFQEIDKKIYDGLEISGREVVEIITKTVDSDEYLSIEVINKKKEKANYNYIHTIIPDNEHVISEGSVEDIDIVQTSPINLNYINPAGKFVGRVFKDKNDMVICIQFIQK